MSAAALLCATLLSAHGHSAAIDDATAQRMCLRVAAVAADQGAPVALTIVLAWHESRLNPGAVSPAGARGVLQAMPRNIEAYGGPDQDPVLAGVVVLRRWRRQSRDWTEAVCRYQAGRRCGPRRTEKASRIVATAERLAQRATRNNESEAGRSRPGAAGALTGQRPTPIGTGALGASHAAELREIRGNPG